MILHVVLYQPRESASTEERTALTRALDSACREISTIQQVRVGKTVDLNVGYEHRSISQQFDYVAVFEFRDVIDMKAYMVHDHHKNLAEMFWNVCDRTMIMDVEAMDPLADGEPVEKLVK